MAAATSSAHIQCQFPSSRKTRYRGAYWYVDARYSTASLGPRGRSVAPTVPPSGRQPGSHGEGRTGGRAAIPRPEGR
eukprot:13291419-Alexandrium_andersonii.AAC.1